MEKKVYYHDTDAGGVVYYGRYLNWLEEARTEYLVQKGIDIDIFRKKKFFYAVRKCTVSYESPARYGDILVCDTKLIKTTVARLIFDQTVFGKKTGQIILKAEVTLVSLDKDFKTTPIPEDIKALLT